MSQQISINQIWFNSNQGRILDLQKKGSIGQTRINMKGRAIALELWNYGRRSPSPEPISFRHDLLHWSHDRYQPKTTFMTSLSTPDIQIWSMNSPDKYLRKTFNLFHPPDETSSS
ncbi:hypothetical protein PGTUg99_008594 [Puccinia graminis f. sp. tritici]|uniref:Uncharacterized protein n=1 Tax=Puccinia graminis f. sp. tritici TaxID=56615 RepID=A0A5B0QE54_PUCGR|nr:hypothetical protein PGTUg99_008594 [Puccinia graminis f. sp. tritici]